ncbi:MAG: DEAD/DEAH box helicase [Pseudomonadota bacterium]|nr:MAG: DEAD/DEAH box helicase [Pseudomonadota bacterium]
MRVEIRDAEWRIRRVDHSSDGGHQLVCEGLSELVRGREGRFLTRLEEGIRVLSPEDTHLVDDSSEGFRAGFLYLDSMIRKAPATGPAIQLGHRAALDPLPFQLDPARQALSQPRPRILIADAVGLGKTLEAGILVSELIARGRGKRILVLAVKSMLAQFQQEFWNRFTIPLVRLDSTGLQRVRNRLPANHNPFHYFDRAIISIDTLKQDIEYGHYLENAWWDIIVIDEAHNVAERSGSSQRARLARRLATRSDALIMLSATPHDGKAESFASLMNMLDPTAIANPSDYAHEDFRDKGLVIRRLKRHVQDQLGGNLPEREIDIMRAGASSPEEAVFEQMANLRFQALDRKTRSGGHLFRTTLKKALYSSPAACQSTIDNRIARLKRRDSSKEVQADMAVLSDLRNAIAQITAEQFSKYQLLLELLGTCEHSLGWNPKDPEDRLVIFTESIPTLEFLVERLPADLRGLSKSQVSTLSGRMSDKELMAAVEGFGQRDSKTRVLICSDVAAEGINLHHLSHRLIHFDVPWSLMTFQQRNGRIDRYGQTRTPQIRYLITQSDNARITDERRVLEVLIEKDHQASKNIGDPSEFMGLHSVDQEEQLVADFMEREGDDLAALFAGFLDENVSDSEQPLENFLPTNAPSKILDDITADRPTLYETDFDYAAAALSWLRSEGVRIQEEIDRQNQRLVLTAPPDLQNRLRFLPKEARPEADRFILTPDRKLIAEDLKIRRDEDSNWAQRQYLWPLHPVMEWLGDRALGTFGRHTAPLFRIPGRLEPNQTAFLLVGGYPNRRGHTLIQAWLGFVLEDGNITEELDLAGFIHRLDLRPGQVPNRNRGGPTDAVAARLPGVVRRAEQRLAEHRRSEEAAIEDQLLEQLQAMDDLKTRHLQQLELEFDRSDQPEHFKQRRRDDRLGHIQRVFDDYDNWLRDTHTLDDQPYIQVAAAFTGQEGNQ